MAIWTTIQQVIGPLYDIVLGAARKEKEKSDEDAPSGSRLRRGPEPATVYQRGGDHATNVCGGSTVSGNTRTFTNQPAEKSGSFNSGIVICLIVIMLLLIILAYILLK